MEKTLRERSGNSSIARWISSIISFSLNTSSGVLITSIDFFKSKVLSISIFSLLICSLLFSGQKVKEKDLAPRFRNFLNLTRYIIRAEEKDVFMLLANDIDRDIFVETFWKMRDPTPGTPANEYKDKHIERFNYANKSLGRSSVREGWRTDMGMIHIILGKPVSKDRFPATKDIYPCEVWYYFGDKTKGLPTFYIKIAGYGSQNALGTDSLSRVFTYLVQFHAARHNRRLASGIYSCRLNNLIRRNPADFSYLLRRIFLNSLF